MSRIHPSSNVALLPQLAIWEIPDTQESVERDIEYEIRPISTFTSSTPLRFELRSPEDEFLLFNESHLWLKLKITLSHPTKKVEKDDWKHVTPVQNLMHSLFKHVSLMINNREVTFSSALYSYRAFFENNLAFADAAKEGRLSAVGWGSSEQRKKILADGISLEDPTTCVFDLEGMLNLDFTFQEKALPGGTQVALELLPNPESFYMKCAEPFKVKVDFLDTAWFVHRAKLYQNVVEGLRYGLSKSPARFCLTRCDVRCTTIPSQVFDYELQNVVMGNLPRRVFLGLISSRAFQGSTMDPYDFQHYNVSFVQAFIDGSPYPLRPYMPDFKKNIFVREFRALYRALNQTGTDTYLSIDRFAFKRMPFFAFNFAPDLSNGGTLSSHVNLKTQGHLRIQLKFAEKTPESLVAVLYCEFDTVLQMDEMRNISLE